MRSLGACLALSGILVMAACFGRRDPPPDADGPLIYEYQNCANCHGERLEGTSRGPELAELSRHWKPDDLSEYLRDPEGFRSTDPRLADYAEEYSGRMSTYDNLTREQRSILARWLLSH